jgi:hypothetical protein
LTTTTGEKEGPIMATVRLGRYELEEYDLPRVCMSCGARASHYKSKKFTWYPPWAWIALGWIGAMMFMKRVTMDVPLCEKHRWHWVWPPLVTIVGLLGIFVLLFAGVGLAEAVKIDPPVVFIPVGVLFLAWLIVAIYLSSKAIRATEITDKSITLRGVSPDFIEALNDVRRGDDDRGRRRRSRRDEDDEDDRPRRRRARDEDDDEEDERPRAKRRPAKEKDDGGYYDPETRRRRRDRDEDDEDDR